LNRKIGVKNLNLIKDKIMKTDKAEKKQIRTFGIGCAILFTIFGTISVFRHGWEGVPWQYIVSIAALSISLFFPILLWPVYKIALLIAHALGWFNTRLFLSILFYLIFTPIALIFRLIGKDPLSRKFEKESSSYWIRRQSDTLPDSTQLERQF